MAPRIANLPHTVRATALFWALPIILTACGGGMQGLRRRFAVETGCQEKATIEDIGAGGYVVRGCGNSAQYFCAQEGSGYRKCIRDEPQRTLAVAPAGTPATTARVTSRKHRDGYQLIEATLERAVRIRVVGAPARDRDHVYFAFIQGLRFPQTCEVRMVADSVPVELPSGTLRQVGAREEFGFNLDARTFAQLAQAGRVVGTVCGNRFELGSSEIQTFREFVMRFQEELALAGDPVPTGDATPVGESL